MNLENPAPSDQNTADHIDQSDDQVQKTAPVLGDGEQDGLNVKLDKNAGDLAFVHNVGLLGDCVLVGKDCAAGEAALGCFVAAAEGHGGGRVGGEFAGVVGVDGGDDGEVVLELFKVLVGGCARVVQRVVEARVEGAEAEFVDLMRKVEGWEGVLVSVLKRAGRESVCLAYRRDPGAGQTPCIRGRER